MPSKLATLKALFWFIFSGTAMLSAFILPVHVWALNDGFSMNLTWWLPRAYFFVLFAAALYHSLYRVKTIAFDLGMVKITKPLGYFLSLLFLASLSAFSIRLFF